MCVLIHELGINRKTMYLVVYLYQMWVFMLLCSGFPSRSLFVYWAACFCMKMVSELWSSSPLLCLKQQQQQFFKKKNLWIAKRFLLWLPWSLTSRSARKHFGDQENSIWDLRHSLWCLLLANKSCLCHRQPFFWNIFAYC